MKILHVNTHMNIGGIGQYILSLCGAMKSKGVDCVVASSGGNLEGELKKSAIPHKYIDIRTKFEFSPKVFIASSSLADIIRKEGIDIVHAHTRVSQVASILASGRTGTRYISTCHGFFKPRLFRKLFDTWGEKVVAISAPVKAHLEMDFGVDPARIELIHNGVDISRFSKTYSDDEVAQIKRTIALKEGPVVGTMGRLSSVKGHRFLIEAMKYIVSKNSSAQCLIIGSGPEEGPLKDLAKSMGMEGRIRFAGVVYEDVGAYLACMDIFVLPSIKEGLGLALLEAMAAARPCIASDIGGISDIIEDGKNGILAPVANSRAIGDAILRLLNDGVLSAGLGLKAREFVKEKFSLDLMSENIGNLYKEVMSGKK